MKSLWKVWIIRHVLSNYSATDTLPNLIVLFYFIVCYFSPVIIAEIFLSYSYADELMIYYDYNPSSLYSSGLCNTTDVDYTFPLNIGFVGPFITLYIGYNTR